jgi:hypothetical protein
MYFFALPALLIGSIQMKDRASWTVGVVLVMFSLLGISVLWAANYLADYLSMVEFSSYDFKRPAFYFYGVMVFGVLGVIASRNSSSFLQGFLKTSAICSIILAMLYLPLYDSSSGLSRIGGDAGLIIGILLSQGVTSILAMIWSGWFNRAVAFFSVPVLVFAIIMSGTRSALSVVVLSLVVFGALLLGRARMWLVPHFFLGLVIIGVVIYLGFDFIPDETLARITNFNLEGSENRWALLTAAWAILFDYPFGKTAGYIGLFPAEIEYSHNATVQIVLEAGLFSIVFVLLLMFGIVRTFLMGGEAGSQIPRGFLFYAVGVYLVSFSAGDAYSPQYWLVTTLLAASGFSRMLKNSDRPMPMR